MSNYQPIFSEKNFLSIGILRRTRYRDLPPFIFVKRDGLFVPFRLERVPELIGEEAFVLRRDVQEEDDGLMTWQDLVGYTIEDEGMTVGVIETIDESTMNTLATLTDGRMVPLHEDFIIEIDEQARVLRVHFPFVL